MSNISPQAFIQGTPEWLELRQTKITATDAAVIMGASHWKTKDQLYKEKTSPLVCDFKNERMQRGIDLEPVARSLFTIYTGIEVEPKVVIKDWAMASLDGISSCGKFVVEIKCPGKKDHDIALSGKVPSHYYPQLQHQMWVCDVLCMQYFSFDGTDGVVVDVKRDDEYITRMIAAEAEFYACLQTQTPPEPSQFDYIERNDESWHECASRWKDLSQEIKRLEGLELELRKQLISLSGQSNSKGAGISLCQVSRKGNVDYSQIPQLKGVDLDLYRKESSTSWRIICE